VNEIKDNFYSVSKLKVGKDKPKGISKNLKVQLQERSEANFVEPDNSLSKTTTTTNYTLKVILIEFNDVHGDAKYTKADFENMLSGSNYFGISPDGETVYGSMDYYYGRMSSDGISIAATVLNNTVGGYPVWLRLSHNKIHYDTTSTFWSVAESAANAAGLNISTGSNTKLVYIYSGNFYTGYLNPAAQPWNNRYRMCEKWAGRGPYYNQETDGPITFSHIGIHCHEFGHLLA